MDDAENISTQPSTRLSTRDVANKETIMSFSSRLLAFAAAAAITAVSFAGPTFAQPHVTEQPVVASVVAR
jgi:hypothetical protein